MQIIPFSLLQQVAYSARSKTRYSLWRQLYCVKSYSSYSFCIIVDGLVGQKRSFFGLIFCIQRKRLMLEGYKWVHLIGNLITMRFIAKLVATCALPCAKNRNNRVFGVLCYKFRNSAEGFCAGGRTHTELFVSRCFTSDLWRWIDFKEKRVILFFRLRVVRGARVG